MRFELSPNDYPWPEIAAFLIIFLGSILFSHIFLYDPVCRYIGEYCLVIGRRLTYGIGLLIAALLWAILSLIRCVIEKFLS